MIQYIRGKQNLITYLKNQGKVFVVAILQKKFKFFKSQTILDANFFYIYLN